MICLASRVGDHGWCLLTLMGGMLLPAHRRLEERS